MSDTGPNDNLTVEEIARVCHEANRALQIINHEEPNLPWGMTEPDLRESAIEGVRLALAGTSPHQLHDAWCAERLAKGWVHGLVKDPVKKTHPCLVPYNRLPKAQQRKDKVFNAIVRACAGPQQVAP